MLILTPGKAGETIRSVYLHTYGVSYPRSIGAFVSERLLNLVAVGALASLAVSMFPEQRLWMFAAIACIVIVILLLRSRLLSLIGRRAAGSSVVGHTVKAEVSRLKAELKRANEERDILKKAATYFAKLSG